MTRAEKKAYNARMDARMAEAKAAALAVVLTGKCPLCARPLRRNLALKGWWQCEQKGAPGFRKDADAPHCEWQGFTE